MVREQAPTGVQLANYAAEIQRLELLMEAQRRLNRAPYLLPVFDEEGQVR